MCGSATLAMVVSSACMMVASMTESVMNVRWRLSVLAAAAKFMPLFSDRESQKAAAMPCVDLHFGAELRAQAWEAGGRLEPDPHGHALSDLHPVAGGVLRGDDGELRARGRAQAFDNALPGVAGIRVHMDRDGLPRVNVGQILLGEIGLDPLISAHD